MPQVKAAEKVINVWPPMKTKGNSASKVVPATFSLVDRAAKWGIIKKNTAARYKSRLTLRLRALSPAK